MIFLQYGGESRLNFIENLCEMVVSSLMYMIKFCEGFVADIFFLYLCFCECPDIYINLKIKLEFPKTN